MKTLFILILLVHCCYANAQSKKIVPGIKLGIGFASHSPNKFTSTNSGTENYNSQVSLIGGVKSLFPLTDQFNVLPEIVMLGKGSRVEGFYSILKTFYQFNFNALYRSKGSQGGFLVGAGPFVALPGNNRYDENQYKTDAGINILAGYQVPIGFSFELHYMKSFTKQNLNYGYYISGQEKREVSFSDLGFTVGYFF